MRRSALVAVTALASVGLLAAGVAPADAASPNDAACIAASGSGTTWNSARLQKYEACRFDKLDAAVAGLASPAPSPTPTAEPTSSPLPSDMPTTTPTSESPTPPAAQVLDLPRVPWEGADYYAQFPKAKAAGWADPSFFPIAVFFGKPSHAAALKAVGVNTYMGAEHDGSTLASITSQGISVVAQDEWTRAEVGDNTRVVGWHVSDECDMGYSGCTPDWSKDNGDAGRLAVQKGYVSNLRAYDDGRFLQANFGNGVARTWWAKDTMDDQIALMDTSSVDKYLYTSPGSRDVVKASPDWPAGANPQAAAGYGWLQDQMERFQDPNHRRPNWVFVEAAKPLLNEDGSGVITVPQIEGAVWSQIIHGARGIAYFQHNNSGCGGYALVECGQALKDGVKKVNGDVTSLAPVINTQSFVWDFQAAGVDTMLKVSDGSAYVFSDVGLKGTPGSKTLTLPDGVTGTSVEVVGEGRTLPVTDGKFTDTFAAEYTHHVYRINL